MAASRASVDAVNVGQDVGRVVAPQGRTRKRKRFQHGNYTGYYVTRYGLAPGSAPDADPGARDPRIKLMKRSWFEGRRCLDVGCNEGDLTLALVRTFRPRQMVGVDIDGYLVQRARKALTAEVDAVAGAARRRAEEGAGPDGSSNGGTIASTGRGSAMTRPLMPRSLRGKPHGASGEKPAPRENKRRTQGEGLDGTNSGSEGGENAGAPEVSSSTESEANPGRRKNGVRRATSAVPQPATGGVSQGAIGGFTSLKPAPAQKQEIAAAGGDPGPRPGQRRPRPSGSHAPGAHDGTEGGAAAAAAAAADATDVRCLSGCAVSFRREDFVADPHDDLGYDVVCLFSVVKWMHLNGGDEAVRNVFRKAYALLRPGGRLVLEPQPWKSYKKSARQHGSQEARLNADKIKLRPSEFPVFLTEEVGFHSWEEIGVPNEGVGGFANRSVHVFVK